MGVSLGWTLPLINVLARVNARTLEAVHDGVQRMLWCGRLGFAVLPVLSVPAWSAPAGLALVFFAITAMRPGRG